MERETITIEEYRRLTARQKRGRATRPDLPAAPKAERTGLSTLIAAGWNVVWDSSMRLRLYRGDKDTGYHEDEKTACDLAKSLA